LVVTEKAAGGTHLGVLARIVIVAFTQRNGAARGLDIVDGRHEDAAPDAVLDGCLESNVRARLVPCILKELSRASAKHRKWAIMLTAFQLAES
jgi:hypothetical protein